MRMFSSIPDSSIHIERVSAFKNNNPILIFYYIFSSLKFIQPRGVPSLYFWFKFWQDDIISYSGKVILDFSEIGKE
jgi:hypothetical protein